MARGLFWILNVIFLMGLVWTAVGLDFGLSEGLAVMLWLMIATNVALAVALVCLAFLDQPAIAAFVPFLSACLCGIVGHSATSLRVAFWLTLVFMATHVGVVLWVIRKEHRATQGATHRKG